jgi:hypothetical protein
MPVDSVRLFPVQQKTSEKILALHALDCAFVLLQNLGNSIRNFPVLRIDLRISKGGAVNNRNRHAQCIKISFSTFASRRPASTALCAAASRSARRPVTGLEALAPTTTLLSIWISLAIIATKVGDNRRFAGNACITINLGAHDDLHNIIVA